MRDPSVVPQHGEHEQSPVKPGQGSPDTSRRPPGEQEAPSPCVGLLVGGVEFPLPSSAVAVCSLKALNQRIFMKCLQLL